MTYVLSDIHGNLHRVTSILEQINLQPDDELYVLGDVIDRYPHGIQILQSIMKMPNVRMLLGNHEYMMLQALDTPYDEDDRFEFREHFDRMRLWYRNGGMVTENALLKLPETEQKAIFRYLHSLPINLDITVNGQHYKLVHGSPIELFKDCDGEYQNKIEFTVWNRLQPETVLNSNKTVIFGHTPTAHFQDKNPLKIWRGENRIGIDCGCGFPAAKDQMKRDPLYGRLACLRLEDMKEFYSEDQQ